MKTIAIKPLTAPPTPTAADERGNAAAKAMSKALLAEHKRWKMPFISWKNGKVVSVKP
ncbi:hypothetical protein HQ447_13375 [bacterium]|nr:hypothetical protein [bacterium]